MRRKMSSIIMIGIWGVLLLGLLALHFIPGVQHFLVAAGEFVLRRSLNEPIWVERFTSCWMLFFIFAVCFFGGAIVARKKWKIPFLLCANLFLNWFMMEYGIVYTAGKHYDNKILILSILTYASITFVLIIISQRVWLSGMIGTTLLFLYSIANYYTIKFHSSPLTLLEVRNAKTALNVANGYSFAVDTLVASKILLFTVSITILILIKFYERRENGLEKIYDRKVVLAKSVAMFVLITVTFWFGYFCKNPVKPAKALTWSWYDTATRYGLSGVLVETTFAAFEDPITKPKGFGAIVVPDIDAAYDATKYTKTPDIIVVLNESFFDLRRVVDLQTDTEFMSFYDSLPAVKGYAVAPKSGGGTNSSEYELLTSNSHNLVNGTPFQVIDLQNMSSVVSVMKENGYEAMAFHPEPALNYNRNNAYPNMGFDNCYFRNDIIPDKEYGYHNRMKFPDKEAYALFEKWYESMGEGPRFCYLLTIQNHGGYSLNDAQWDLVHVDGNYGVDADEMNEYLTSIKQSDEAIEELISYFSNSNRDVVVCFVGDHGPSFISDLNMQKAGDVDDLFRERATPFFIWSNFEEANDNIGYIGMIQLLPYMMERYSIMASPYYDYMAKLRDYYPVIANGLYMEENGTKALLDIGGCDNKLQEYFNLEYKNIKKE